MKSKQKEILKKIRVLPLRKYGSVKHKKLIKEYTSFKHQASSAPGLNLNTIRKQFKHN